MLRAHLSLQSTAPKRILPYNKHDSGRQYVNGGKEFVNIPQGARLELDVAASVRFTKASHKKKGAH